MKTHENRHELCPYPSALSAEDAARLDALYTLLEQGVPQLTGYPCNQNFNYHEIYRFLDVAANNIGDPWLNSNYSLNTLEMEREVISSFAQWTKMPQDNIWGYVTSGGTEGNMYGLYLARELYPTGIVYYSEDTHYSVHKIIHVLGMRSIMIRSQENGEMDYDDLRETLRLHRDTPPIIFANIGTTMKQAIDNIPMIRELLKQLAITQSYIHSDAALSGGYLPFIKDAPAFDFAAGVQSISISGHKFIGSPVPCGIALALKTNVQRIGRTIEYIGAMDTTIPGSRSAFSPLILWYALRRQQESGMKKLAESCLAMAEYTVAAMNKAGIPAWRNPHAITVVFPRPSDALIRKWSLAPYQQIAHVITMGHITTEIIDAIIADICAEKES
jgi:histidine decarboxylase